MVEQWLQHNKNALCCNHCAVIIVRCGRSCAGDLHCFMTWWHDDAMSSSYQKPWIRQKKSLFTASSTVPHLNNMMTSWHAEWWYGILTQPAFHNSSLLLTRWRTYTTNYKTSSFGTEGLNIWKHTVRYYLSTKKWKNDKNWLSLLCVFDFDNNMSFEPSSTGWYG